MVGLSRIEASLVPGAGLRASRWQRAAALAVAAFAFFALVLYAGIPGPGYLAVLVAFAVWGLLPGLLFERAVLDTGALNWPQRVGFAFLLSLALAALPGLAALTFHWSLEVFGLLFAALAAAGAALSILSRHEPAAGERIDETPLLSRTPQAIVAGLLLLAVLVSPLWAGHQVARDSDDITYTAFVNSYRNSDSLDASDVAVRHQGAFGRMEVNVWLPFEALLSKTAGVAPSDLLLLYLPALLTALVMISAYTLARGLFKNETTACLAAIFVLIYAGLDLSPHEGYGRNVLLRIGEDKMVATFILLPLALLLIANFVSGSTLRRFLAVQAALVALLIVHPSSAIFAGIALAGLVVTRSVVERSPAALRSGVEVALPWALPAVAFFLRSQMSNNPTAPVASALQFRHAFHITTLGHGWVMGNYHMLIHPFVLAAVLLAPVILLLSRRSIGNQLLFGCVITALAVFWLPFLATPMAKAFTEQGLWRLPWLVPVPIILAYACVELAKKLEPRIGSRTALVRSAVPLVIALLAGAGALAVQEQYFAADNGAFYTYASSKNVFPWTDQSIAAGGIDRASSGDWQVTGSTAKLVDYLRDTLPANSKIVAPEGLADILSVTLKDATIVNALDGGTPEEQQLVNAVYSGLLPALELRDTLRANGVDYVIASPRTPLSDDLHTAIRYTAGQFSVVTGAPVLAHHEPNAWSYWAWALPHGTPNGVGGLQFTVPADIDRDNATLMFKLIVAPARQVDGDQSTRFLISYQKAGAAPGPVANAVLDIPLLEGAPAEGLIVAYRTPRAPFLPGDTYEFTVSRLGAATEDTYPADMLFAGMNVQYQSTTSTTTAPGTNYDVIKVPPNG